MRLKTPINQSININKKFIVFSDSMSVLQTLKQPDHPNPLIQQFFRKYVSLCRSKTIIFCWIPSHINIKGNEMADQEAKDALNMDIANVKIPFTDKKQQINELCPNVKLNGNNVSLINYSQLSQILMTNIIFIVNEKIR